nr:MAG TPA: Protein of unknown function (DUF1043) [Caudoviricetes sp.]
MIILHSGPLFCLHSLLGTYSELALDGGDPIMKFDPVIFISSFIIGWLIGRYLAHK